METVLGNRNFLDFILSRIKSGTLAHAYLIVGKEGSGKKTLALLAAKTMVCSEKTACGKCNACRKAELSAHPDIHILAKETSENSIKVESVRKFISGINLAPNEADTKIYIIEEADTMSREAQNILLKTLEEPVGNTAFFLLASSEAPILPTVRSRCMLFRTELIDEKVLSKHLHEKYGIDEQKAIKIARFSGGCVGDAYNAVENKSMSEYRTTAFEVLCNIAKGDKNTALAILTAKNRCTKEQLVRIYSYMQLAMRDVSAKEYADEFPEFFENGEDAFLIKSRFSISRAMKLYDLLENEKAELMSNMSPTLSAIRTVTLA